MKIKINLEYKSINYWFFLNDGFLFDENFYKFQLYTTSEKDKNLSFFSKHLNYFFESGLFSCVKERCTEIYLILNKTKRQKINDLYENPFKDIYSSYDRYHKDFILYSKEGFKIHVKINNWFYGNITSLVDIRCLDDFRLTDIIQFNFDYRTFSKFAFLFIIHCLINYPHIFKNEIQIHFMENLNLYLEYFSENKMLHNEIEELNWRKQNEKI